MNSLKSGILIILLAFMRLTATVDAQTLEINKAKAEISELLKKKATVMKTLDKNDPDYYSAPRNAVSDFARNLIHIGGRWMGNVVRLYIRWRDSQG